MFEAPIRRLHIRHERWPLAAPFRISRGVKSEAEVVVVELTSVADSPSRQGLGECVPCRRYGETVESVIAAIESVRCDIERGADRSELQQLLPAARLIVDANEGWNFEILQAVQQTRLACGAVLLEQPLPAHADQCLEGFKPSVPICANESCHTIVELPALRRRYQAVNLKLDKTGGLTAAIELAAAAREAGFMLMVGCMVCTSLAIAPAWLLTTEADFVDLDGPLLLARDREGGVRLQADRVLAPQAGFWGEQAIRA